MFVLPGAIALIVFFILRLQEIYPALHGITVPQLLLFGAAGLLVDFRLGRVRWPRSGFMSAVLFFMLWSVMAVVVQLPRGGMPSSVWLTLGAAFGLFFLLALGLQSVRSIRVLLWAFSACIVFATAVAVEQGTHAPTCLLDTADGFKPLPGPPVPCEVRRDCEATSQVEPDTDFACESVGWGQTSSIYGRVRYRGVLEDPNELSWVVTMTFPLVIYLVDEWAFIPRVTVIGLLFLLDIFCVIMTQSRSGQLSFLVVMGALTWRRLGIKGVIAAAVMGSPVLLLGGRSGEGADSSTLERLGCWNAGINIWRDHPLFGVGPQQMPEYHTQTAHNSFILTLAEGGPLQLFAWTALFWQLFRTLSHARATLIQVPGAQGPTYLATTLSAALVPTLLSCFFLSMAYKTPLWALFGVIAAFEATVYPKVHQAPPSWRKRDALLVVAISVLIVVAIFLYLKTKDLD